MKTRSSSELLIMYLMSIRENILQITRVLPILSESEPRTNDPNNTPAMNELIVAGLNQDL